MATRGHRGTSEMGSTKHVLTSGPSEKSIGAGTDLVSRVTSPLLRNQRRRSRTRRPHPLRPEKLDQRWECAGRRTRPLRSSTHPINTVALGGGANTRGLVPTTGCPRRHWAQSEGWLGRRTIHGAPTAHETRHPKMIQDCADVTALTQLLLRGSRAKR